VVTTDAKRPSVTPPQGDEMPVMDASCGYGYPGPLCGRPATWHIIWTPDTDNGMACDEHAAHAAARWAWYDRHPMTETCSAPERQVIWSWDDPPGKCAWVVSEETLSLAQAAALVSTAKGSSQ